MKRLEVVDLSVDYGGIVGLRALSMAVEEGELVGLFGANGAGKSTALKAILGLVKLRTGRVLVNGLDVTGEPAHVVARRGIALVPEGRRIFKRMTVRENLQVGAVARGAPEVWRAIDEAYELFPRLRERQRQLAGTLSGGEQQMLAIGRALMAAPAFVLYDEPSLGLAPMIVENVFAVIARLARERGIGGVLVEQNVEAALGIVSRACVLARGAVVLSGRADELRGSAKLAAAYLGTLADERI
jgi:branched-chain amino acid transport system ATP-binding protein